MSAPGGRRYRVLLVLAGAVLAWERLWPRLAPPVLVGAAFAALALLDLLPGLPGWLHAVVLAGFAVGLLWAGAGVVRRLPRMDRTAARHRLESDSGLANRPLTALEDELAAGDDDPVARTLWQAHRRRAAAVISRLRVRPPEPGLPRRDPLALRIGVGLLLIIGLVAGGDQAAARFKRALLPALASGTSPPVRVEVWITPPAYTRMAPLFLRAAGEGKAAAEEAPSGPVPVPFASTVLARVSGVGSAPQLAIGDATVAFVPIDRAEASAGYSAEAAIRRGTRLAVRRGGRVLAEWPLAVVADVPPEVAFARPPRASGSGLLELAYRASDDYGVSGVRARLRLAGGEAGTGEASEIGLKLPLPEAGAGSLNGVSVHNLTSHPWAGRRVRITLEVVDGAGQVGTTLPAELRLPERRFTHPVAQAIIAERKRLDRDTPLRRHSVAYGLQGIAAKPERFFGDVVVSLALSVAHGRLMRDRSRQAIPSVRRLLWETALRLERGEVPLAEEELHRAGERLAEALRSDADAEQVEHLTDALQRALDRYLSALAAQLARRTGEALPLPPDQLVRGDDLRQLVETARQLARAGARDSARRLLAELQRIVDGIRAGLTAGRSPQAFRQAQQMMSGLRDLAGRQQALLDDTSRRLLSRRLPPAKGGAPAPGTGGETARGERMAGLSAEQEALRRRLGGLMLDFDRLLGGIPAPLGEAERAMHGAAKGLRSGRLGVAAGRQSEAVEALRRAMDAGAALMAQRLGGPSGLIRGGRMPGNDPFGRRAGDGRRGFGSGEVRIPEQAQLRRVEEILRELRRRAGERERPTLERDYIDRLLRRF